MALGVSTNHQTRWDSRVSSAPYQFQSRDNRGTNKTSGNIDNKNNDGTDIENEKKVEHSSAFPKTFQHCGYLDVRTKQDKPWKRRYFVVNNNFLLSAATPHAKKLDRVIPLEGSNIRQSTKSSDMTFELFIRKHKLYFRAASPKQCTKWTNAIQKASKLKIKDIYRFLYTLGTSGMTKVVAAKHRTTNEDSAIKIIDKRMCDKKMLKTEIQILKKLDSPYIVSLYDLIETKKYLYIVMEKCEGGELFDQIAELDGDHYSEEDCCLILHQIAKGVKYMHKCGIVHRDLKPENILCIKPNSIRKVKIADFGISKILNPKKMGNHINNKPDKSQMMHTVVGTISYTAPEVLLKKPYDYTVDFWSIGVIMHILLCGYPPFYGDNDKEVTSSILNDELEFDDEDWDHVSIEAKNLCKGLLNKDSSLRNTCDDILKLAWKVSSKSLSFAKARKNFKQTVIKRKFHRHSLSVFEKDPLLSRKLNMRYGGQNDTKNMNKIDSNTLNTLNKPGINKSFDDLTSSRDQQQLLKINKENKFRNAFRGPRRSKGTEELLELKLPLTKRDSLFAITEEENDDQ